MNGLFTLTWSNIKSAVVYGVLTSVVTFLAVFIAGIVSHGSIYGVDWANLLDKSIIATLGVWVAMISILKNLLTTSQGKFLGFLDVIPDKDPVEKSDIPIS